MIDYERAVKMQNKIL